MAQRNWKVLFINKLHKLQTIPLISVIVMIPGMAAIIMKIFYHFR